MKASIQYKAGRFLFYWFYRIFGLRIEGVENVPREGGVIIAPNHRSNYDPPLVGCGVASRPIYFLAKKGLFINKAVSWILRSVCAIPVDTDNPGIKTMRVFIDLLKEGKAVMVFPEGQRSKTNEFLPPYPGVGYLSIRTKVPVVPVLITGTHESMLKHFLRKKPLALKFGSLVYPGYDKPTNENAKELTEKIMERIKGLA
ncbi:1-acyl-sn-glycerol-3-phosphate acyltransferase [candidate division WOR-3 bacterium]|nr:1-acyl-sn-glycerol-3-phosphate acyltransferase [candidate division WOR-3 bacterium]